MTAFDECRRVEAIAMEDIIRFIKSHAFEGRYVTTDKGRLSKELQKTAGDLLINDKHGLVRGVELKAEMDNRYGNFYLETWSNKSRNTPGWMITLRADTLLYYFVKQKDLYAMSLPKLQEWAIARQQIERFPEKKQNKYTQLNDTWGRCVPIRVVGSEVGFKRYSLIEDESPSEPLVYRHYLFPDLK